MSSFGECAVVEAYPWHDPLLDYLSERLDRDRLPAAIGISCPEGWGGHSLLARASMLLLGIESDKAPEDIAHPDFRWVVPDGAVIKIDQVRALNAFAVQTRQMANRKVAAVIDAHLLNVNAANTLLKTLEEPPPNTHIVLCTPYWSRLLPTIRSRCQYLQVSANTQQAQEWLQAQGVAFSEERFAQAGYAPIAMREQFAGLDLDTLLNEIARAQQFGPHVDQFIDLDSGRILGGWYRLLIQRQRGQADRASLAFAEELNETRRMIETSNSTNVRLALERLFHLWQQLTAHHQRHRRTNR